MKLSKYEKKKIKGMTNAEAIAYIGELVVEERLRAWRYWGLKAVRDKEEGYQPEPLRTAKGE